ncbi:MAG TPA: hypothetical protein VE093_47980 [Polyangiaceae bacterium]|nr:hypothetical protein [Polyangiaceae bacterium]
MKAVIEWTAIAVDDNGVVTIQTPSVEKPGPIEHANGRRVRFVPSLDAVQPIDGGRRVYSRPADAWSLSESAGLSDIVRAVDAYLLERSRS